MKTHTNIKTYLRYFLIGLVAMTIIYGCQKDEIVSPNEIHLKQLPHSLKVTIEDGSRLIAENKILSKSLKQFSPSLDGSRTLYSDIYGFAIDTSRVQQVETDAYKSYTFTVEREDYDPSVLENYIFTEYNDSTYYQLMVSYPVIIESDSLRFDIANATVEFVDDTSLIYNRQGGCVSIVEYQEPVCTDHLCQNNGGQQHTVDDGADCALWGTVWMATRSCTQGAWIDVDIDCGPPNAGGPGGSGGGGPGGSIPNDPPIVTISFAQYYERIDDCINGSTTFGNSDNTTIDPNVLAQISGQQAYLTDAYLKGKGCSEESQILAIIAIGNSEIDIDDVNHVEENFQDYRSQMSDDELILFDSLSTETQYLYLISAKQALDKTNELYSTFCEKYNGKGDAFRHALWNALASIRIGVGLTNQLTTRHENRPPIYAYEIKEVEMDLFNNQIGRDIVFNGNENIDLMNTLVLDALNNGNLRYLNNQDIASCRATNASQLIPTNQ